MKVDKSIFKAYDIRGIYPESVNEELTYKLGLAFCKVVGGENKKLEIVVSRDMRDSSNPLRESLIKGLIDSGADVIDVGLASTPTFYFAVAYYGYDGGIQISASHNPKEYNGFKLVRKNAGPISDQTGINKMRDLIIEDNFELASEKGKVTQKSNVLEEEVKVESKGIDLQKIKPFKIVVDAANSMGAPDIEAMFIGLPCEVIRKNFDLDGSFPVHAADPLKKENLAFVSDYVKQEKADLGISIDGDGDRYFFVDEKGDAIDQPILRGLMAQIALKENPGATVCFDIRPGRITRDMIEEVGGKYIVTRVGHTLIKQKMLEENAVFGGESSGHYFYKFPFGTFEAPIVLVRKLLVYLSEKNMPVSEIFKPYKKYFHTGEVNSKVKDKKVKMEEIKEKYSDGKISLLDGITIEYPDYWFNVRPSNTEPLLRFALEAKTKELMEEKKEEITQIIRA